MATTRIDDSRSRDRPLTVDDLPRIATDERYRYELVDGRLEKSPALTQPHARTQARLAYHLTYATEEFETLLNPSVVLNTAGTQFRRPDMIVLHPDDLEERYVTRPPLLIVEVLSPDSVFRDMHTKRREYAKFGVPTYWIINPARTTPGILELRLEGGEYRTVTEVDGKAIFETDLPFPTRFVPHWLVAEGVWRQHIGGD